MMYKPNVSFYKSMFAQIVTSLEFVDCLWNLIYEEELDQDTLDLLWTSTKDC